MSSLVTSAWRSACCSVAIVVGDCPRGADHTATIDRLHGACAVAFTAPGPSGSPRVLVATPESPPGAGDVVAVDADGAEAVIAGGSTGCAADVDVADDGTIAIADLAGRVVIVSPGAGPVVVTGALRHATGVAWRGEDLAVSDACLGCVFLLARDGRELVRLGEGVLREPHGLDVASDGSVFVADRLANRIAHFAADAGGALDRTPRIIGERGTSPGQFNSPCDVAILERAGGGRCLVVADELNHRVQVLSVDGAFVSFFGMHALFPRQGEGRIHYPRSVAVSPDGARLAVAEPFEDRVQLFDLKPEPNPPDAVGGYEFITSHFGTEVACAEDLLVLVDTESQGVALLDARTTPPIHMAVIGGLGAMSLRFTEVSAVAVEPGTARVWVADRGRNRLEVFETVWDREKPPGLDMFMPRLVRSMDLALLGRERDPIITDIAFEPAPRDRGAADAGPRVVLLDARERTILRAGPRLDPDRTGAVERLPDSSRWPVELALRPDGVAAVADPVARRVYLRDTAGAWSELAALGGIGFIRPTGVAFAPDGSLVVSDAARDACVVGTPSGDARVVGERGELDEQFFEPHAICASPKGLIVVDRGNHRFQRFGDGFTWNLTGSMGRYFDRKRRGSPGAAPSTGGGES